MFEFGDKIADSNGVLFGLLEPAHRFRLAREKLVDAGRFFEQCAAVGRLARENGVHLALGHDRIGSWPQPGAHQQIDDVAQPDSAAIDEVLAFTGAIRAARNLHLGELDRKTSVGIVERHRQLPRGRAACACRCRRR